MKSLYKDSRLILKNGETRTLQSRIKELVKVMNSNFERGSAWRLREINSVIERIDESVECLSAEGEIPMQLLTRLRAELTNVDRVSNRIDSIIEAPFIPAAYRISEIAVGIGLLILLFTKIDPLSEGLLLFGFSSFLLVSLLLMIKAMDNPFEGYVKVDLKHMHKLEGYLENSTTKEEIGSVDSTLVQGSTT